ncbi:MAG: hypothetical protein ACK4ZY_15995, partial [Sphingomonas sp.]
MSVTVTRMGAGPSLFKGARSPQARRHPGLVPGSTVPHHRGPLVARAGRPRNKSGVTVETSNRSYKWLWALLAIALALLVAMPAFAQAAPAAPAPGVGDAVDRALGQLSSGAASGGTQSAPLSLSLQVLIIM